MSRAPLKRTLSMLVFSLAILFQPVSADDHPTPVAIPFFVLDSHGVPVADGISGISVGADRAPLGLAITVHSANQVPLRLGILIDASRSQAKSTAYFEIVQAVLDIPKELMKDRADRVFAGRFSTTLQITDLLGRDQVPKWTAMFVPAGGTALYDSIAATCYERMQLEPQTLTRRVLVIVSDGGDNQSRITCAKAIAASKASGTVIFAISTNDMNDVKGDATLKRIASETGGVAFLNVHKKDIPRVTAELAAQIQNMYLATYVLADSSNPKPLHSISISPNHGTKWKIRRPAR